MTSCEPPLPETYGEADGLVAAGDVAAVPSARGAPMRKVLRPPASYVVGCCARSAATTVATKTTKQKPEIPQRPQARRPDGIACSSVNKRRRRTILRTLRKITAGV
jgi:hypothetical protein